MERAACDLQQWSRPQLKIDQAVAHRQAEIGYRDGDLLMRRGGQRRQPVERDDPIDPADRRLARAERQVLQQQPEVAGLRAVVPAERAAQLDRAIGGLQRIAEGGQQIARLQAGRGEGDGPAGQRRAARPARHGMGAGDHQGEVPGLVGQPGREIDPIAGQAGRPVEPQRHEGRRARQVGDAVDLQGGLKIGVAAETEVDREAGSGDPPLRQGDPAVGDPAGAAIAGGPAPLTGHGQARPGDVDRRIGQLGELQLGELDGPHAHGVSDPHPARSAPGEAGERVHRRVERQDDVA